MQGFSQLQIRALTILLATFIIGLGIKYWRDSQPLPEVDPKLEERFIAIAESLNTLELSQEKLLPAAVTADQNGKLNINTATMEQLQRLPGIGPVLAERIIKFRDKNGNFPNVNDLRKVQGIGKKTLENLSDLIIID